MKLDDTIVTLKNTDAALHNFEEAVLLFFEKRKPISICTLAHAAHEILSKTTKDSLIQHKLFLTEIGQKKVWDKLSEPKNFAKHPYKNDLTFDTWQNEIILLDCAYMIKAHIIQHHLEANAFGCWMIKEYPDLFTNEGMNEIEDINRQIDFSNFEHIVQIIRAHRSLK